MKRNLFLLIVLSTLVGCGGVAVKPREVAQPKFPHVDPPMTMTDPESRLSWVVVNYFKNISFADTVLLNSTAMEQAYVDWINLLQNTTPAVASQAIAATFKRSDSLADSRNRLGELSEQYLYDPNSPMRNEDLYIMVLQNMLASPALDSVEKIRPSRHLQMALKNRVGQRATGFSYQDINGVKGSLSTIKEPYTLIFFNNPDCPACKEISEALSTSAPVGAMVGDGRLKVLALYTDEDLTAWRRYAPNIASTWTNAYNTELHTSLDYDLKAIPTLYLLDKDKKVLLKDVDFRELIPYIEQISAAGF